jgi:hypothetical protein
LESWRAGRDGPWRISGGGPRLERLEDCQYIFGHRTVYGAYYYYLGTSSSIDSIPLADGSKEDTRGSELPWDAGLITAVHTAKDIDGHHGV